MKTEELAYLKWEAAGKPEGRAEEFWLEAEKELGCKRRKYKRKTKTKIIGMPLPTEDACAVIKSALMRDNIDW